MTITPRSRYVIASLHRFHEFIEIKIFYELRFLPLLDLMTQNLEPLLIVLNHAETSANHFTGRRVASTCNHLSNEFLIMRAESYRSVFSHAPIVPILGIPLVALPSS